MNQKEAIGKLDAFLEWFVDNHGEENWLNDNEEWISYLELPEFVEAEKAIQHLKQS